MLRNERNAFSPPRGSLKRRRLAPSPLLRHALIQGGEPARSGAELHAARSLGSIVIVVIVAGAQPTGLRVDRDLAGLAVHQSRHLQVASLVGDHEVRPSVRLQFRFDLLRGDWTIARDEHRPWLL